MRLSKKQAIELTSQDPAPSLGQATSMLPSKFKVPRRDENNQSAHVNFYTAPYYIRIAQEIQVRAPNEFGTLTDVYACALHYGLKYIQEEDETIGITSVQSQLVAWMQICQETEMEENLMVAMDKLRETVNRKIGHKAVQEARRLVALVRHSTELMPDGYYKTKALEFLNNEFSYLYDAKKLAEINQDHGQGQGIISMEPEKESA